MMPLRRNCADRDREREKLERAAERKRLKREKEHSSSQSDYDSYEDEELYETAREARYRREMEQLEEEQRMREKYAKQQPPFPLKEPTAASAHSDNPTRRNMEGSHASQAAPSCIAHRALRCS